MDYLDTIGYKLLELFVAENPVQCNLAITLE